MARLISKTYSNALFKLALETNKIDEIFDDVSVVLSTLSDGELINVILHPQINYNEKVSIIENTYAGKICDEVVGLLVTVIRKNRENELINILRFFIQEVEDYKGIATAKVTSAEELTEKQLSDIERNLAKSFNKKINLLTSVDKSLIGGMVVNICGVVIDGSVRTSINEMKQNLFAVGV